MAKKKNKAKALDGEIVTVEPDTTSEVATTNSVIGGLEISTKELKRALDSQTEQRELIKEFIQKHLVKGVDFLRIHVVKNCNNEANRRGSCAIDKHFSKDILAKPGQEKIFSLFQLTSKLEKDVETMEMLEGVRNLVAYKCLAMSGDKIVAEGRGAAAVGEKGRDANATIKIAEKRARMDACLALGFSEYFAQDLDDPDYQTQRKAAEEEAEAKATDGTGLPRRDKEAKIDDTERHMLAKWLLKLGFNDRDEQLELLTLNGIEDPKNMTSGQARDMILKLKNATFAAPVRTGTVLDGDIDAENLSENIDAALANSKPQVPPEPLLDVDDELKATVEERAGMLHLNQWGLQWLMKRICGRPLAKWDSLKDEEWRKAYDVVQAILEGQLDVEPHHIKEVKMFPEGTK